MYEIPISGSTPEVSPWLMIPPFLRQPFTGFAALLTDADPGITSAEIARLWWGNSELNGIIWMKVIDIYIYICIYVYIYPLNGYWMVIGEIIVYVDVYVDGYNGHLALRCVLEKDDFSAHGPVVHYFSAPMMPIESQNLLVLLRMNRW